MKKLVAFFLLTASLFNCYTQNNIQNAQKYWHYRKRLKENFIQIDPGDGLGTNIPVASLREDGSTVSWGDGNGGLPYYIALLATEYRLLKNNGIDSTRDELIHALTAFERLDYSAETYFRDCHNIAGASSLNGFFIRNEPVGINGKTLNWPCGIGGYVPEESKDNVWHYLLGSGVS